jgi:NAD(P)-dependent dehydrogenase (short-subunit alcohol dehydrogenase family)
MSAARRFAGVSVITGASSGIGRALAVAMAAEGASLVLADIDAKALHSLREKLNAQGHQVEVCVTHVGRLADIEVLCDTAYEKFGRVDWLFNNAGILLSGNCWEISAEDWQRTLDVNLGGVIHAIRVFVPKMIAQGGGHIINTSSIGGLLVGPWMAPYTVTKHGITVLTEALYLELQAAGHPVKVSLLCPGAVATGIAATLNTQGNSPSAQLSAGLQKILSSQGMSPEDLALWVLNGVADGRFWLFPHPEQFKAGFESRNMRIVAEQSPQFNFNF